MASSCVQGHLTDMIRLFDERFEKELRRLAEVDNKHGVQYVFLHRAEENQHPRPSWTYRNYHIVDATCPATAEDVNTAAVRCAWEMYQKVVTRFSHRTWFYAENKTCYVEGVLYFRAPNDEMYFKVDAVTAMDDEKKPAQPEK